MRDICDLLRDAVVAECIGNSTRGDLFIITGKGGCKLQTDKTESKFSAAQNLIRSIFARA